MDHGWSATWAQDGRTLSAVPLDWNTTIPPEASVQVGFNGTWTGSYTDPAEFQLNDTPCD